MVTVGEDPARWGAVLSFETRREPVVAFYRRAPGIELGDVSSQLELMVGHRLLVPFSIEDEVRYEALAAREAELLHTLGLDESERW